MMSMLFRDKSKRDVVEIHSYEPPILFVLTGRSADGTDKTITKFRGSWVWIGKTDRFPMFSTPKRG